MKKKTWIMLAGIAILAVAGAGYYRSFTEQGSKASEWTTLRELSNQETDLQQTVTGELGSSISLPTTTDALTVPKQTGLSEPTQKKAEDGDTTSGQDMEEGIYVHLCGAVRKPDVYRLKADSRLVELIILAGGLAEDAAGDYINQAMALEDGQRIYIPRKDEVEELTSDQYVVGSVSTKKAETGPKLVNINRADAEELMELPGIGEAKAESIIAYRNANGEFTAIEELMKVPGIKEGLYGKLVSFITVH